MMRSLLFGLASLAAAAVPAAAQEAGSIGCAQDFGMVKQFLMDNRSKLSEQALTDAERRLSVAGSKCMSSTSVAQTELAQLRRDLKMQPMESQAMMGTLPRSAQ